jgi:hypothetical protein
MTENTPIHLPPPDDLTLRQALAVLYHLQHWEAIHATRIEPYAAGLFYRQAVPVLHGLANTAPKTALKHFNTRQCYVCESPTVTIDHLFATAKGGPDSIENYGLLCGRHNSSKGSKDLLAWWAFAGFPARQLPREVLCLYTRVLWQHLPGAVLREPATAAVTDFVQARAAALPSRGHLEALYGAAYATCWLARLNSQEAP